MSNFYSNNNRKLLASIHKLNCVLSDVADFKDEDVIMEYVVEKQHRNEFHLERGMIDEECATLSCRICNSDQLIVGQKRYFTAIKCGRCGYELGIHEG